MEKDTKYRRYLEGLKKATKKESFLERRMKLASPKAYMKSIGVFPKINKDTLHKTLMSGKNPYSDLVNTTNKGVSKVGEDFVKRRMKLSGAGNVLSKIPRVGKIIGAAIAGYGAAKLGEKDKKMGGGMMKKYKSGSMVHVKTKIGKNKPTKIC